jgi:hypothetical protein
MTVHNAAETPSAMTTVNTSSDTSGGRQRRSSTQHHRDGDDRGRHDPRARPTKRRTVAHVIFPDVTTASTPATVRGSLAYLHEDAEVVPTRHIPRAQLVASVRVGLFWRAVEAQL